MAEQFWPDADPLGEVVRPDAAEPRWRGRVVGVVANVRQWGPEQEALPEIYFPHTAEVWGPIWGQLVVRSAGDPEPLTSAIRAAVREVDPTMPTALPITMGSILQRSTARRRFSMTLVSLFAATALLLVVAGTYGVTSYGVARRTHEIGVRMALGAREAGVMRLFLARAAAWVLMGLTVGVVGAWVGARLTGSMVYGIRPLSAPLMAAGALVMVLVAVAATAFPVRRASTVNPVEALRVE
jgi:putative ABC transport system permease protein